MKKYIGIILIMFGIVFGIIETSYFGGNFLPQSFAELICDILALIAMLVGIINIISSSRVEK